MVKIACKVPNGIMLRLFKEGRHPETGAPVMLADGVGVRLNGPSALHTGIGATEAVEPAFTDLDPEWWSRWSDQNKDNVLMKDGHIYEHKDDPEVPTD